MAESDPSSPDLEFYTSNRGARKLAYKGYQYGKDKEAESKIYWKCQDRQIIAIAL